MSRCSTFVTSLATTVALAAPTAIAPVPAEATAAPSLQPSGTAQQSYCETTDDLTFGGVFNLTVDAISAKLADKPELQKKFEERAYKYGSIIGKLPINRMVVNTPASQIGGPARDVDDHAVNLVVSAIMKAHDNGWRDTVQLKNITLNEAIESILTVLYFGSIPVELWGEVMPDLLSLTFLHIFSVSPLTVPKLTAQYGPSVVSFLTGFVQEQLQNNCINRQPSRSTPNVYRHNPREVKRPTKFPGKQVLDVQKIVDGLNVASETCRPLSEYTIRDISTEIIEGMGEQVRPEFQGIFKLATDFYLKQLDTIKVNRGLIPMRSDQVGGLIELIDDPTLTYGFTVITAPFDKRLWQWKSIGDISIENGMNVYTLTADVTEKIVSLMWELIIQGLGDKIVTSAVQLILPSGKDIACLPSKIPGKVAGTVAGKVASAVGSSVVPIVGGFVADKIVSNAVETAFKPLNIGCGIVYSIIGGPDWELNVVPNAVPLLFFYPDYIHPVVHGVTRSMCLAKDEGKRAIWRRTPDMIEDDAKLAERRGTYTIPDDMYFTVPVVNWKLPNPIKRDEKWKDHEKEVPDRTRVFDKKTVQAAHK